MNENLENETIETFEFEIESTENIESEISTPESSEIETVESEIEITENTFTFPSLDEMKENYIQIIDNYNLQHDIMTLPLSDWNITNCMLVLIFFMLIINFFKR